jgi:hypothetical protein
MLITGAHRRPAPASVICQGEALLFLESTWLVAVTVAHLLLEKSATEAALEAALGFVLSGGFIVTRSCASPSFHDRDRPGSR